MCGLVGIAATRGVRARDWLGKGSDAIWHRGPDSAGEWWSEDHRVGLAHRRLAIVDLTSTGHQPMSRGELTVVYNGEIYNFAELRQQLSRVGHAFSSTSDTEVLIAAYREWGTNCLSRIKGMFAFAIYDASKGVLFLARDRVGEKPLYYWSAGGELRFASELKALLADPALPRRIAPDAFDCYLADGYVPGAMCILAGFAKLPPAHALLFSLKNGSVRVWRYWSVPEPESNDAHSDAPEFLDELERLLSAAVRRQLVADVPVGVLLSGGVDSSLITAFAARARNNVRTFTVTFPSHGAYDESAHARMIARAFGTQHLEVQADSITPALLPVLARQFDEPMTDSSMLPMYLVSKVVRQHCTVALGGDGGDELFGGYPHYDRMAWLARRLSYLPYPIRFAAAFCGGALLPVGYRGRNWLQAAGCDFDVEVPAVAQMFDRGPRRRLRIRGLDYGAAERVRALRMPKSRSLLQRAMRLDFENYLVEDLLVKVDRASMLNSLEVRAPLLDVDVVEFALGRVPINLKVRLGARKLLLKQLAARMLPPEFDQQRKQGFSIPLSHWLQAGEWREFFSAVLLDPTQNWCDRSFVANLLSSESSRRSNAERLFGLLMFELWRREYHVEMPA